MFIHVQFEDGSNPWVRFGLRTAREINQTVKEWESSYDMELIQITDAGMYYLAKAKTRINNHRELRHCINAVLA